MAARKSKRRKDKGTREREDLVRRSPVVSVGAKLLWIELVRGWAWNDDTCFPGQEALAEALSVGIRSIQRWSAELRGHGLIEVRKTPTGNFYSLAQSIPEDICPPDRLMNRSIVKALARGEGSNLLQTDGNSVELVARPKRQSGGRSAANLAAQDGGDPPNRRQISRQSGGRSSANLAPEDENKEDERVEDEISTGATTRAGNPESTDDLDELLEEEEELPTPEKKNRKSRKSVNPRPRGRKSAKIDLVGVEGGLATAHRKAVVASKYEEATPPPPWTTEALLELLRSEIREKYGDQAARSLEFSASGKDKKSCQNTILSKFSPEVALKMVRVLVWDWEMVRTQFPPAPLVKHPRLEHLVRYRAILSTSVDTGVDYDQKLRGSPKSYANRYLDSQKTKYDNKINPY